MGQPAGSGLVHFPRDNTDFDLLMRSNNPVMVVLSCNLQFKSRYLVMFCIPGK